MRSAYRVPAYLLAVEVVIRAAAIAFAVFGLTKWVGEAHLLYEGVTEPYVVGGDGGNAPE
jgi:hypothetical protein